MKSKHAFLGLLAVLLGFYFTIFCCSAPEGKSYYVSPEGSDSYAGTLESPFGTVQKGCNMLSPGDTLYIKAGVYNEKLEINSSGTKNSYITIRPYGQDRVILSGEGNSERSGIIHIKNESYVRINGLELRNSRDGDTPSGIMIEGCGSGIEILENKIYAVESDSDAHGIAVYGTNGFIPIQEIAIKGNEVYDCRLGTSEAVVVNGNVKDFQICGNVIHDNNNIAIDCIGFENTALFNDQPRYGLVEGNIVYNISSAQNRAYGGDACASGIYVDGGRDIVIERNRVHNCDIGIEVASEHLNKAAENILVRSNLIYACSLYGLSLGGAYEENGYAKGCSLLCNTLYGNQAGINIQKSRNNVISSNIIYGTTILLEGEIGSNVFEYNLWYSPNKNLQSLHPFKDPQFKDPDRQDFRLSKESPAIDAGTPRYSAGEDEKDLLCKPRVMNGRVDCGAFEFEK